MITQVTSPRRRRVCNGTYCPYEEHRGLVRKRVGGIAFDQPCGGQSVGGDDLGICVRFV
jgi:hypothetical protein